MQCQGVRMLVVMLLCALSSASCGNGCVRVCVVGGCCVWVCVCVSGAPGSCSRLLQTALAWGKGSSRAAVRGAAGNSVAVTVGVLHLCSAAAECKSSRPSRRTASAAQQGCECHEPSASSHSRRAAGSIVYAQLVCASVQSGSAALCMCQSAWCHHQSAAATAHSKQT